MSDRGGILFVKSIDYVDGYVNANLGEIRWSEHKVAHAEHFGMAQYRPVEACLITLRLAQCEA